MNIYDYPSKVEKSTLVRNHDMVHLPECYRVSGVKVNPWLWAEGKTCREVLDAADNGIKFCRSCRPLEVLPLSDAELVPTRGNERSDD
jgi:hypothetical protein